MVACDGPGSRAIGPGPWRVHPVESVLCRGLFQDGRGPEQEALEGAGAWFLQEWASVGFISFLASSLPEGHTKGADFLSS